MSLLCFKMLRCCSQRSSSGWNRCWKKSVTYGHTWFNSAVLAQMNVTIAGAFNSIMSMCQGGLYHLLPICSIQLWVLGVRIIQNGGAESRLEAEFKWSSQWLSHRVRISSIHNKICLSTSSEVLQDAFYYVPELKYFLYSVWASHWPKNGQTSLKTHFWTVFLIPRAILII